MTNRKQQLENLLDGAELRFLPAYGYQYVNRNGKRIPEDEYNKLRTELICIRLGIKPNREVAG